MQSVTCVLCCWRWQSNCWQQLPGRKLLQLQLQLQPLLQAAAAGVRQGAAGMRHQQGGASGGGGGLHSQMMKMMMMRDR